MTTEQMRTAVLLKGFNDSKWVNLEINSLLVSIGEVEPTIDGGYTIYKIEKGIDPRRQGDLRMLFGSMIIEVQLGLDNKDLNKGYIMFRYSYTHLSGGSNGHKTLFRTLDNGKTWELQ